jgi:hypothetical protein
MWSLKGFTSIGGYKRAYILKIRAYFIANMHWEEGSTKGFWEIFTDI